MKYWKKNNLTSIALFLGVVFPGCMSTSVMQTAKTTPNQTSEIGLGVGNNDIYRNNYSQVLKPQVTFPELYFRRGLSDVTDFGLKITLVGGSADVKHIVAQNNTQSVYFSSGAILDYYLLDQASVVSISLPLYLSIHPSDIFAIYAAGKGGLTNARSFFEASLLLNYSATAGVMLGGKTVSLFAEITLNNTGNYDFIPSQQITGGVKFILPNNIHQ